MPKSKGRFKRNKSEKDKKKGGAQKPDTDITKGNGIKITSKGNFLKLKNTKTPEEHAAFLDSMKENRPQILVTINLEIEDVIKIFEEYDNLKLLGGLAYNQLMEQFNPKDDGLGEVILDYGLSFSTSIQGNPQKEPTTEIIAILIQRLANIRQHYMLYILAEGATEQYALIEHKLRFKMIMESLFTRGDGYSNHIYSLYNELFDGHNDFLKSHYGFTSKDILESIIQIENTYCTRLRYSNGQRHPALNNRTIKYLDGKRPNEVAPTQMEFIQLFSRDNPDILIKNSEPVSYRIDQISSYPELYKIQYRYEIQKTVISTISQEFGDNIEFLNPHSKCFPLNESRITTKPIIKIGENFYLFSFTLPTRNLFNITEALIKEADINYYKSRFLGNAYNKSRDNFLEEKSAELLKKLIPDSQVFLGLKYKALDLAGKTSETELDILITSNHANYLIEVKAGGLSAPARRGALDRLTGQLKKSVGVGYGAYQSFRALNYIHDNNTPSFKDGNKVITPIDKSKKMFRITITMEHLSGLIANMSDLKDLGIIDHNVDFAWTCSIFDLMIFSEILESEEDFIDFLEKRIQLYNLPNIEFNDEIDILGHFLKNNLSFNKREIHHKGPVQMAKFSKEIDAFFENGAEKPQRKKKR